MAKQGKTLTDKKLASIRADYEAGIESKSDIAKKHRINRYTLRRNAEKRRWEYGKSAPEVASRITKKATEKIVREESEKLVDYTRKHISEIGTLRTISRANAQSLIKAIKETGNNVSKEEADRIFTVQKVCKIMAETLSIIFRDERLAMGVDSKNERVDSKNENTEGLESRIMNRMNKIK